MVWRCLGVTQVLSVVSTVSAIGIALGNLCVNSLLGTTLVEANYVLLMEKKLMVQPGTHRSDVLEVGCASSFGMQYVSGGPDGDVLENTLHYVWEILYASLHAYPNFHTKYATLAFAVAATLILLVRRIEKVTEH